MANQDDGKVELAEAFQTASKKGYYHLSARCRASVPLISVGRVRVFPREVCTKCWGAKKGGQITAGRRAAAKKKAR